MTASESNVQARIRLEAANRGVRLWRNNNGAGTLRNGSHIRWGLANDSAAYNKVLKSADLIGIRAVVITPDMVGKTIGQFVSMECKPEGWKPSGKEELERYEAQMRWCNLINSMGGFAAIVDGTVTIF